MDGAWDQHHALGSRGKIDMGNASRRTVDPLCPADGGLFTVRDRLIASDTTFIYNSANGLGVTLVGRGFRYDGSGRRLLAGRVKTMIVFDADSHEALVTLEGLSIDIDEATLSGAHAISAPAYWALARAAQKARELTTLAATAGAMLDRMLEPADEAAPSEMADAADA